jgi:hypothetical protein
MVGPSSGLGLGRVTHALGNVQESKQVNSQILWINQLIQSCTVGQLCSAIDHQLIN